MPKQVSSVCKWKKIKLTVSRAEEMEKIESTVAQTENFMIGQFILSLLLNLVLSGTLSQLWNIFNTLQLLTSLPLFQVNTPANVVAVHATFDELSHF